MDRDEVIERLCRLQREVQEAIGFQHEADCFCGKSGLWGSGSYGPTHSEGYRNDGAALEFMEAAVRTAIRIHDQGAQTVAAAVSALEARGLPDVAAEHVPGAVVFTSAGRPFLVVVSNPEWYKPSGRTTGAIHDFTGEGLKRAVAHPWLSLVVPRG